MIRIRPFKLSDIKYILAWVNEERQFSMWCANKFHYPLTTEQMHDYKEMYEEDEYGWSFTALAENGRPIGHFLMRKADYHTQSVHIGFVIIDPEYRGRGYGKEMMQLAVEYATNLLQVNKITLAVFDNNPAAYRCYKAVGFEDETYIKDSFSYKDEKWGCYYMQWVLKTDRNRIKEGDKMNKLHLLRE